MPAYTIFSCSKFIVFYYFNNSLPCYRIPNECGELSLLILERVQRCHIYSESPLCYLRDLACIHDPMEFFLSCGYHEVQEFVHNFMGCHLQHLPETFMKFVSI